VHVLEVTWRRAARGTHSLSLSSLEFPFGLQIQQEVKGIRWQPSLSLPESRGFISKYNLEEVKSLDLWLQTPSSYQPM